MKEQKEQHMKLKKELEIYKDIYSREAPLVLQSVNEEERAIDGVLTTEAPAIVFDWYRWEPIQEVLLMSGAQLPERVVFLNAHSRYSGNDVIGSTTNFKLGESDGYKAITATNYFSSTEQRLYTKAKEGHLRDTSIGYLTSPEHSIEIKPGESRNIEGQEIRNNDREMMMYVRTKWWLKENSIVPIGADQRAKLRAEIGSIEIEEEKQEEIKDSFVARSHRMNTNIHTHLKNLKWKKHKC